MNLMRLFTGIAGIIGGILVMSLLVGIPTLTILLLLKLFGVI